MFCVANKISFCIACLVVSFISVTRVATLPFMYCAKAISNSVSKSFTFCVLLSALFLNALAITLY